MSYVYFKQHVVNLVVKLKVCWNPNMQSFVLENTYSTIHSIIGLSRKWYIFFFSKSICLSHMTYDIKCICLSIFLLSFFFCLCFSAPHMYLYYFMAKEFWLSRKHPIRTRTMITNLKNDFLMLGYPTLPIRKRLHEIIYLQILRSI